MKIRLPVAHSSGHHTKSCIWFETMAILQMRGNSTLSIVANGDIWMCNLYTSRNVSNCFCKLVNQRLTTQTLYVSNISLCLNLSQKTKWFCVEVLRPSNPMGSCRARSVYLTTRLLGRLSPLSSSPVSCTFFRQKLTTALLESAEGREWP